MFVAQPSIDLNFLQLSLEFKEGFEREVVVLDCFKDHHLVGGLIGGSSFGRGLIGGWVGSDMPIYNAIKHTITH